MFKVTNVVKMRDTKFIYLFYMIYFLELTMKNENREL